MPEQDEKLSAIIPDFFAELIGRIAPGLVLISLFLYWSGRGFSAVFSSVGLWFLVLTVAWIIGVVLDVGVFCICVKFIRPLFGIICILADRRFREISKKLHIVESLKPYSKGNDWYDEWEYVCNATAWERGIINKSKATRIFFRNMASISGLTFFIFLVMEYSPRLNRLLPVLHHYHLTFAILAFVSTLIFLMCWKVQCDSVKEATKELIEKYKRKKSKGEEATSSKTKNPAEQRKSDDR